MKTPPFLLFAALLFWGWQSGYLLAGAAMGAVLELARFIRFRWELDEADFSRIWTLCVLLNVMLAAYVFTSGEGGALAGWLHGQPADKAADAAAPNPTRFLCWLPMTTFALMLAQAFNRRPSVPLTGISLVLRWRQRRGEKAFASRFLDISYPYFVLCIIAAGVHTNNGGLWYFAGQSALAAWALWAVRPRRFRARTWLGALVLVCAVAVLGGLGISRAQSAIQNFNAQWMSRFFSQRPDPLQSMTAMGRIGRLKLSANIVIRLEPREVGRVPGLLREASYRVYQPQQQTWYAGSSLHDFAGIAPEADDSTWVLLPEKKNSDAVSIACYLNGWSREADAPEGLLPLPSGCGRLEHLPPNMVLRKNKNGAVLAAGRGLLIFDAVYGHGAGLDAPPDIGTTNRFDLMVPTNEIPALQQAIAETGLPPGASPAEKTRAIEKFFLGKFTYSVWQDSGKLAGDSSTPLTKFLTVSRSGHCEYFATATVLLLRQLGIPARYAVGYAVHEPRGTGFVVRARDAHAWCLVWNDRTKCWDDLDTTPPSWLAIESRRTAAGEWLADLRSWLGFQIAKFRWRQAQLQQYVLWALVPVLLVLCWHIVFRRRNRRENSQSKERKLPPTEWPGLDSEFYELEKRLAGQGLPRQAGEPMSAWLERALAGPALEILHPQIRELLRLHYRHRFDPEGLDAAARNRLAQEVRNCLAAWPRA